MQDSNHLDRRNRRCGDRLSNTIGWLCYSRVSLLGLTILISLALSKAVRASCRQGCSGDLSGNTFLGEEALASETNDGGNTAIGFRTLNGLTTGIANTAVGNDAPLLHSCELPARARDVAPIDAGCRAYLDRKSVQYLRDPSAPSRPLISTDTERSCYTTWAP